MIFGMGGAIRQNKITQCYVWTMKFKRVLIFFVIVQVRIHHTMTEFWSLRDTSKDRLNQSKSCLSGDLKIKIMLKNKSKILKSHLSVYCSNPKNKNSSIYWTVQTITIVLVYTNNFYNISRNRFRDIKFATYFFIICYICLDFMWSFVCW